MAPTAIESKALWAPQAYGVYGLELGRSVRRTGAGAYCGGLAHSLFSFFFKRPIFSQITPR